MHAAGQGVAQQVGAGLHQQGRAERADGGAAQVAAQGVGGRADAEQGGQHPQVGGQHGPGQQEHRGHDQRGQHHHVQQQPPVGRVEVIGVGPGAVFELGQHVPVGPGVLVHVAGLAPREAAQRVQDHPGQGQGSPGQQHQPGGTKGSYFQHLKRISASWIKNYSALPWTDGESIDQATQEVGLPAGPGLCR